MFLYSGKLGKRTPCGPNEVHPTSTGPGSPEILCNPFCLPSPELAHQDGPRLSASRHLVCDDLPDIYLIPPNGDPLKTAICVWDSRFDGVFSSFLDSDPSTPVATPRFERDWISLASAYKKIEDEQKDLPIFRRPSNNDIQAHSVTMPRASAICPEQVTVSCALQVDSDALRSFVVPFPTCVPAYHLTADCEANTSWTVPQYAPSSTTDKEYSETQDPSMVSLQPILFPAMHLSRIPAGPPTGSIQRSAPDNAELDLLPPQREVVLKAGGLSTPEKKQADIVLKAVSSQSREPSVAPMPGKVTNMPVSAVQPASDVPVQLQTHVRTNVNRFPPPCTTARLNIDKALPSIPFQLPQLSFVADPVEQVVGSPDWVAALDWSPFMGGGNMTSESSHAKSSQVFDTAVLTPADQTQDIIMTARAFQPTLEHDKGDDSDAASMSTTLIDWSGRDGKSTSSSRILASLEEVATVVRSLNPLEPSSSMRLLQPSIPLLPPLEFDPYGFAGDFDTYLYLKTARGRRRD